MQSEVSEKLIVWILYRNEPGQGGRVMGFLKTILEMVCSFLVVVMSFEKMMLIGYARVSTQDQNLELERTALLEAGCEKFFDDKMSGSRSDRPGLSLALDMLRAGDTLVVWKLDSPIRRRCAIGLAEV